MKKTYLAMAISSLIFSQIQANAQEVAEQKSKQVEVIEVTAAKISGLPQDTPLALSVMGGDDLIENGVNNVADIQNIAPGVSIGRDSFGVNLNIRGVTTTDTTSKGEQGIAFNVDGVPIGRPREQGAAFYDVNRVEILRGPQGTLYGKSSTGGVINVITNKPQFEFAAKADLEVGNYDARSMTAVVNVPMSDKFAMRAAVNSNKRDGYLETDDGSPARNDRDDLNYRLSGLYEFSEETSLLVTSSYGKIGGVGVGQVPLDTFYEKSGKAQRQIYGNPFGGNIDEEFSNITANFTTAFNGLTLNYVGGYRKYSADTISSSTYDVSRAADNQYDWSQYQGSVYTDSHEITLANSTDSALTWILGINWYYEDITESDHRWAAPADNATLAGSLNSIDPVNSTDHESKGLFGQANYALTDALTLTLGLRLSNDEVVRNGTFAPGPGPWPNAAGGTCIAPEDCIGFPNNATQSDDKLTYRLGFDYDIGAGMVYGSIATGYKAGGFNDFDPNLGPAEGPQAYEPESLTAYEVGYKGKLSDNLRLNSSLYYYDYAKAQISYVVFVEGSTVLFTRSEATKIWGWENELAWDITDFDSLDVSFTTASSEYNDFQSGQDLSVDWSGYSLDKVSDFTAMLTYSHMWELSNGGLVRARLNSRFNGGYTVSDFVSATQFEQDSFTRTDASVTYEDEDGRFSVTAFVSNLEDKLQILSAPSEYSAANPSTSIVSVSEPRLFGLRMSLKY